MEWYQYYYQWLLLAFTEPWRFYEILSGALGLISTIIYFTVPKWKERMKKPILRIPWVIAVPTFCFIALCIIGLVTAPYKMHLEDQVKIWQYSITNQELTIIEKSLATGNSIPSCVSNNEYINLSAITTDDYTIADRIYNNCGFYGQATICLDRCSLMNCDADNFSSFITSAEASQKTIKFYDCVMKNCHFYNITFVVSPENKEMYERNFGIK